MKMTKTNRKPVVLGLGNPLFSDEGVGIHIIHQLMASDFDARAELVDGGTDGLMLLSLVEEVSHLIVVDAISGNLPPGSIQKLELDDIPIYARQKLSPHQLSFQEVLALASMRDRLPQNMVLFGVQPATLEWGTELSPEVQAAVPVLIDMLNIQIDYLTRGV